MQICSQCETFTSDILNERFPPERWQVNRDTNPETFKLYYFRHSTLLKLLSFVKDYCQLCQLMLRAAKDDAEHRAAASLGSLQGQIWIRLNDKDRWGFYVEMPISENTINMPYAAAKLEFFQIGSTGVELDRSAGPSIRAEIDAAPDGERAVMLARNWLHQCLHYHEKCARSLRVTLPPRILDLGSLDNPQEPTLVDGFGNKGTYLTLSHVWGGKVHGVTTMANVEQRRHGISSTSLPRTFRDAIYITRKLGFQYLWIDCLCIVQDSIKDRKANCRKMSSIYTNSTLTIANLWARDSSNGIFCDRNSSFPFDRFNPVHVSQESVEGQSSVWVRVPPTEWQYAFWGSTLNKRAWVLQERVLSPATLYYWTTQMFWECRSCTASESQPKPIMNLDGQIKSIFRDMQREGLMRHPDGHLTAWYLLIEEYTSRELTFPSDRLHAIQGLAERFGSVCSLSHFYGLWINDLYRGLLWARKKDRRQKILPDHTIAKSAPSWSWLAVTLRVTFAWINGWGHSLYYPVLRVATVSDAEIIDVVQYHYQIARSSRPKGSIRMWSDIVAASYMAVQIPEVRSRCQLENPGYCILRKQANNSTPRVRCALDFSCDVMENDVICARIASWEHDLGARESQGLYSTHRPIFTYYLVLQRIHFPRALRHPLDKGLFRRIGIGADEYTTVDEFFKSSSKYFLAVV